MLRRTVQHKTNQVFVLFLSEEIRFLRRVIKGKNIFKEHLLMSDSLVSDHPTSVHLKKYEYDTCENLEISKENLKKALKRTGDSIKFISL